MKIAIIGAGISGLSIGQMLKDKHEVRIFESADRPGGMMKCKRVNGHLFHLTGGHVFNTKKEKVADWFWKHFNKKEEFTLADRNSIVHYEKEKYIPYPIENHIYLFDKDTQLSIIKDWLSIEPIDAQDFETFLKNRFGDTLYNIYFSPYNKKIWRCELSSIPLSWLEGKLPMPTVEEMLFNNINNIEERNFVHSRFYYPINDGSQFIINRLAEGLNITYSCQINKIEHTNQSWKILDQTFDHVIFCGNIKQVPQLIGNSVENTLAFEPIINGLLSHGTTSVLCEIDKNPYSWVYLPSKKHESHRIICTGNFSPSNNASRDRISAVVEFTDRISEENILENLSEIPFNPTYITHNYAEYTYPIQDNKTRNMVHEYQNILKGANFHLLGRFAQWEYNNMDICIENALILSEYFQKF